MVAITNNQWKFLFLTERNIDMGFLWTVIMIIRAVAMLINDAGAITQTARTTSPWVQGLFGTYSYLTPIMAEQKCVCGHIWGDPVPTNCRVLRADGHFNVSRALYYPYHQLWVPGPKGYLVHIAPLPPIMAERECVCGHVWGDPVPTNCRVLRADGHFTVARTLYYPYHQLWVLGFKGYLVHITILPA